MIVGEGAWVRLSQNKKIIEKKLNILLKRKFIE